ncbi:hypothetical protein PanWU01x14_370670 [Parasponia andersonii]|uniref:Uncharacterized protein n=1 Tax=Parasponia andersonii TaxID=3476 RepID=A0A2P5A485_PARAD|nr:hypothetical protein PanWU01x14_370670 [Parasponia andersonii]
MDLEHTNPTGLFGKTKLGGFSFKRTHKFHWHIWKDLAWLRGFSFRRIHKSYWTILENLACGFLIWMDTQIPLAHFGRHGMGFSHLEGMKSNTNTITVFILRKYRHHRSSHIP